MSVETLSPRMKLLTEEYVLVQAWKKTAVHIRQHNWYSDTLALDRVAVNLPRFLGELRERILLGTAWVSDPLRIVPAPKSQEWEIHEGPNGWRPVEKGKGGARLRPLAHVSLADQVVSTALMLCLADRVETLQGDPREPISNPESRRLVVSYGNRLFCDKAAGRLYHRWGTRRLYRAYYQDYRTFLERPDVVARSIPSSQDKRVIIVHSDLRQFYDRVRPELLSQKLRALAKTEEDQEFYDFASRVLTWRWHEKDVKEVARYAKQAGLDDFSSVGLPQGLVAAGFFANLVLLDLDTAVRVMVPAAIGPGVRVEDACRYVDDFRITLVADRTISLKEAEDNVVGWLTGLLNDLAPGVEPSEEKTRATLPDGDERPLVRQSRRMSRIQKAISGGFDAAGGEEILSSLQGLMRAQQRYSARGLEEKGWTLAPVADVRDSTVARFAAGRFRSTYRSLRPLLAEEGSGEDVGDKHEEDTFRPRSSRTRLDLDDEVRAFALGLVENWVQDPSNVRLLRIGLDLWPDRKLLTEVLGLLRPFTEKRGRRGPQRRVAWYCLAEVLRAGAIETGFVEDEQSVPPGVDIAGYRELLTDEAARLVALPPTTLPWYLKQQAFLLLAVHAPTKPQIARRGDNVETKDYRGLIKFLRGEDNNAKAEEFATLAILCRRAFGPAEYVTRLIRDHITVGTLEEVATRDPAFAVEILEESSGLKSRLSPRLRDDLCLREPKTNDERRSLSDLVFAAGRESPLRSEPGVIALAIKLLRAPEFAEEGVITPNEVEITMGGDGETILDLRIVSSRVSSAGSLYLPPPWCSKVQMWRFRLGYLLRFVLTGDHDYTWRSRRGKWQDTTIAYHVPASHWLHRRYAFFNGQAGFEDDWLPISDWIEGFLSALLRWPGCHASGASSWVEEGVPQTIAQLEARLNRLKEIRGSGNLWLLPMESPNPEPNPRSAERPLRACVVQTVIPNESHFDGGDLTLSAAPQRRRHRNHLSSALSAVERMLALRETHLDRKGRLDWLILPELSVHSRDVRTHLVPFARAHRCIVLAGLTYEELLPGQPLVNSAIWVIPRTSPEGGLETITRRQGKWNLASLEKELSGSPPRIRPFRPCQWLVGYRWSAMSCNPLWMTCAVCYDATDLGLMATLRRNSDVLAIPALNRDVGTFDHMALALHYHMFQLVIVANNGKYGGSNAYMPRKEEFRRQVFHLHGQPQASMAFLEIDDIAGFLRRKTDARAEPPTSPQQVITNPWKYPPAGIE
jgi:hypothetical protein